jgi:glyoxylase-like metal-dependent hydrolase (beta-lactamase superfamily II)
MPTRRDVLLQPAAALLTATLLPRHAAAADAVASPPPGTVEELAPRLWALRGCGGNVVVFHGGSDGVLLVDGGAAAHTATVLRTVRRLTGSDRVHTLFNTHWHWDQTGANDRLGAAGTRIIAHENTRLWLGTDIVSKWESRSYPRLPKQARPTVTTYTRDSLAFGGETIDYVHLPQAHTDSDLIVHFRGADVIAAGDIAAHGQFPIIDFSTNGWIGGLADAAKALVERSTDATRIVPGHGSLMTRVQLQEEAAMLAEMRQRLARLLTQGLSAQELVDKRPAQDYEAAWGDPTLFIRNAWPGLVHRARELGVSIV